MLAETHGRTDKNFLLLTRDYFALIRSIRASLTEQSAHTGPDSAYFMR